MPLAPRRPVSCGLAVFALAMALGCSDVGNADGDSQAIQGGVVDTAHPAVGLLKTPTGFCTATLISPHVVLTAGHCVKDTPQGFYTVVDAAAFSAGVKHVVADAMAHPSYDPASSECPKAGLDVALVRLSDPIVDIEPVSLSTEKNVPPDTSCLAVGFGRHSDDDGGITRGTRRSGNELVGATSPTAIEARFGDAIGDHGDSGGPLLCGERIVGATSCHLDGDWPQHKVEYYTRISEALPWISTQLAAWETGATSDGVTDS